MLLVWLVHSFLKLPKADISENFRFLAGVLGCRRGRIETEQQNDQDEDEWRHAHGRKIARAMMASRTPSNGLVMANQKETSQSDFLAVVFMLIISSIRRSTFQKGLKFFLHAILPRLVRKQDHATHETLELAERESPFHRALNPHCRRGDPVGGRRATGAYARS